MEREQIVISLIMESMYQSHHGISLIKGILGSTGISLVKGSVLSMPNCMYPRRQGTDGTEVETRQDKTYPIVRAGQHTCSRMTLGWGAAGSIRDSSSSERLSSANIGI